MKNRDFQHVRVAFFDAKPYDIESFNIANKDFGFTINYFDSHLSLGNISLVKNHEALCIFVNDLLTKELIEKIYEEKIRLIALRASGYNNVDLSAVYRKCHVVRVPAYSPYAVAEHATALILTLNRKIHKAYNRTRDHNFSIQGLLGFDLNGKTAGIIGTGQIGRIMIKILNGFGMRVLAYDYRPDRSLETKLNFNYVDLDILYKESDIITLHCPLTKETKHMINDDSISKMKEGVMIINTGRGMLIDSKSLVEGLKLGRIGSAGLDVYEEETNYFFEDFSNSVITDDVLSLLLSFNNVLITSHQAFFTKEALSNIAATTLSNMAAFFSGQKLENEICYKCGREATSECFKKTKGLCFDIL